MRINRAVACIGLFAVAFAAMAGKSQEATPQKDATKENYAAMSLKDKFRSDFVASHIQRKETTKAQIAAIWGNPTEKNDPTNYREYWVFKRETTFGKGAIDKANEASIAGYQAAGGGALGSSLYKAHDFFVKIRSKISAKERVENLSGDKVAESLVVYFKNGAVDDYDLK